MADKKIKNILVIKPSSLGDVLHAFPAVSLVADHYPDVCIDWLINKPFAPLVKFHPNVHEAIIFPRKELGNAVKFPKSFYTLVKKLRGKHYDLIIDFQGLMRSAFFAKAAKSSRVIGFANPREKLSTRFYNEKINIPEDAVHAVEKNLHLVCSMLKIDYRQRQPEMQVIEEHRKSILEKLKEKGIDEGVTCIGVAPVARWISKSWPPAFFAKTINRLHQAHPEIKFVLTGVPEDKPAADEILQQVTGKSTVSLVGETTINELVELLRHFKLLISNDSGPMHIACALQIPVFGLYGPTDPAKTGPFGDIHHVFQGDLECSKCFKKECPSGKYRCHDAINIDTFADAVLENIMTKSFVIKKVDEQAVLSSDWSQVPWSEANIIEINEVREESSDHHPQTELKLLYTDQSLFGLFRVQDQYVRAVRSGFQSSVCRDSCVEFFFKPKHDGGYFNCEFNCSGAMLCFYIVDNTRIPDEKRKKLPGPNEFIDYTPLTKADLTQIKIYHSMPERVEPEITKPTEWYLGFELPLAMLEKYTGDLGSLSGQNWEANCYKCADETSHPHWLSWNPIKEKNFHTPECFGELVFDT